MNSTGSTSSKPVTTQEAGIAAAKTLARRIQAKNRYRHKRDRKIAVDWLGREFTYLGKSQLTGNTEPLQLRLSSYNPHNHSVVLYPVEASVFGQVVWDTDQFWSLMRHGTLLNS